ncbi:MAG: DUF4169 family protein [Mangrovicoccus sp.]
MADKPISLSKFRKARARSDARAKADANAVKFGRTKAEKAQEKAETETAKRQLEAHKREDDRRDPS